MNLNTQKLNYRNVLIQQHPRNALHLQRQINSSTVNNLRLLLLISILILKTMNHLLNPTSMILFSGNQTPAALTKPISMCRSSVQSCKTPYYSWGNKKNLNSHRLLTNVLMMTIIWKKMVLLLQYSLDMIIDTMSTTDKSTLFWFSQEILEVCSNLSTLWVLLLQDSSPGVYSFHQS